MQAESAYSEDHNLNSHGSHAPSCTTSFFRGGTNEADQEEVQAYHYHIIQSLKKQTRVAPKKWLVCKRKQNKFILGNSRWVMFIHIVHVLVKFTQPYWMRFTYPTLLNEICKAHTDVAKWRDWKSKKFEHLSVNHECKVLKCDLEVSKIIEALEMMLDDQWIFWSSFENTLASNSTHCRA